MRSRGLTGDLEPLIVVLSLDDASRAFATARELRNAGFRAEAYVGTKKFGDQLKYADKRGAALAIIEGGDEIANGQVTIKNLAAGAEMAKAIESRAEHADTPSLTVAFTTLNLGSLNEGLPPIADIYVGTLNNDPYYLTVPSAADPTAPLHDYWKAAPGGYVPPFNAVGLDPASTNVTFANPLPVATSQQRIPVIMTIPNASSGKSKPSAGWPVVIFQHGITRNRTVKLLRNAGITVDERTVTTADLDDADELFTTGNAGKVQPVSRYESRDLQPGPIARQAHDLYMAYARTQRVI